MDWEGPGPRDGRALHIELRCGSRKRGIVVDIPGDIRWLLIYLSAYATKNFSQFACTGTQTRIPVVFASRDSPVKKLAPGIDRGVKAASD
jgi:hypothetical protein